MSKIKPEVIRHKRNKNIRPVFKEKAIKGNWLEWTKILELAGKDLKAAISIIIKNINAVINELKGKLSRDKQN